MKPDQKWLPLELIVYKFKKSDLKHSAKVNKVSDTLRLYSCAYTRGRHLPSILFPGRALGVCALQPCRWR